MKLLNQVLHLIWKGIISYTVKNATQKIWEVLGIPCLSLAGLLTQKCFEQKWAKILVECPDVIHAV